MQGWGVKKINVIDFLVNAGSDSEESRTGDREWLAARRREGVEEGGGGGGTNPDVAAGDCME
jgi:hypothetical protein